MRKIDINDIRIDGGTQCREVIDQATVYSYRDSMKEGDEFPRLFTVFDGATYWLVDGFHRYQAMRLDRKSTRLNSSHMSESRMPSSA